MENAQRRKGFLRSIGGGLLPGQKLNFASGDMGRYAGGYEIDSQTRTIAIKCYQDREMEEWGGRVIPKKISVHGKFYTIGCRYVREARQATDLEISEMREKIRQQRA